LKVLRAQLADLRVQVAETGGYLLADAAWHTQVIALMAAHGLATPPAPPPPGQRRATEGS
jgi:hypothetical protein